MSALQATERFAGRGAITVAALQAFCAKALRRGGLAEADAAVGAEALATTDSWGVFTHGTKLLQGYLRRLLAGGIRTDDRPTVTAEGPAWALIDGRSTLGQVTGTFAMRAAIAKARPVGVGYVGVRNTCHFGAAGYYAALAAGEGLVGLAMANDIPSVAAPGSRNAVLGSNPLAYAVPAGKHPPILLDMATSAVAGGKVFAAHQLGKPIPDTWIVGPDGRPTTDGSLYPHEASLQPMAGHKGTGIALLVETLSAVLTGAAVTRQVGGWVFGDPSQPTDHGAAFLAIDVAALMPPDAFRARVDALIDEIHATPRADGVERLYVPGEKEWDHRRRALADGLTLPADVLASVAESARMVDLDIHQLWSA